MSKNVILNYCNQYSDSMISHIENCQWNKEQIKKEEYSKLEGCPSSFGLDDYDRLCFTEDVAAHKQSEQCESCWKKALGVKEE